MVPNIITYISKEWKRDKKSMRQIDFCMQNWGCNYEMVFKKGLYDNICDHYSTEETKIVYKN